MYQPATVGPWQQHMLRQVEDWEVLYGGESCELMNGRGHGFLGVGVKETSGERDIIIALDIIIAHRERKRNGKTWIDLVG